MDRKERTPQEIENFRKELNHEFTDFLSTHQLPLNEESLAVIRKSTCFSTTLFLKGINQEYCKYRMTRSLQSYYDECEKKKKITDDVIRRFYSVD